MARDPEALLASLERGDPLMMESSSSCDPPSLKTNITPCQDQESEEEQLSTAAVNSSSVLDESLYFDSVNDASYFTSNENTDHDISKKGTAQSEEEEGEEDEEEKEEDPLSRMKRQQEMIALEEKHFQRVVNAYEHYLDHSLAQIAKAESDYLKLPKRHRKILKGIRGMKDGNQKKSGFGSERFDELRQAARCNNLIISKIIAPHQIFDNPELLDTERAILERTTTSDSARRSYGGEGHVEESNARPSPPQGTNAGMESSPDASEDELMHDAEQEGARQSASSPGVSGKPSMIQQTQPTADGPCLPSGADMEKVRSTLKLFVRDWSSLGERERQICYKPIVDELIRRFGSGNGCANAYFEENTTNTSATSDRGFNEMSDCRDFSFRRGSSLMEARAKVSVLVPGSGLGRLAYEIAREGFTCQGNEFSFYMLLASNFVLNRSDGSNYYAIYPWIHSYNNHQRFEDQVKPVMIPDVLPSNLPVTADFSMAAGDFLEVYRDPASFDCVATSFFIDTAHNVVAYIERIWEILRPGGCWINFGPLLYHYSDMQGEQSVELSLDEVLDVARHYGFVIERETRDIECTYIGSERGMMNVVYKCAFFVAVKPGDM
eukprot:Nk52_evm18s2449 gene=Nk52_evmTU18s2449